MGFKVQVGPAQIAIHQGQTVLVTDPDGQVTWRASAACISAIPRVISAWAIYANGEPWDLLNGGAVTRECGTYLSNQSRLWERGRTDRGAHTGPDDRPPHRRRNA